VLTITVTEAVGGVEGELFFATGLVHARPIAKMIKLITKNFFVSHIYRNVSIIMA